MKKLLAILLAFAMLASLAACGNSGDEETTDETTTVDETTTEAEPDSAEETTDANATTDGAATTDSSATTVDSNAATEAPAAQNTKPTSKTEIIQYYNTATQTFKSSKPGTNKVVDTAIGNFTASDQAKLDNLLGLDMLGFNVRSVVGGFLGEGKKEYPQEKGANDDNVKLATLQDADVSNAVINESGNNYVIEMDVVSETNPSKDASALGRFTNDFRTGPEAQTELKDNAMGMVTIGNITYETSNVKIKATIDKTTGQFVEVVHSFNFTVKLDALKYLVFNNIAWASGTGTTVATVNNFVW